jgi:hypothetical protein
MGRMVGSEERSIQRGWGGGGGEELLCHGRKRVANVFEQLVVK